MHLIEAQNQITETEQATTSQSSPFIVGTQQHFRWLHGIIKIVLLLNLMDAIFTLFWVKAGLATEANILLQSTVDEHPVAFVTIKLTLVSLGSLLLWKRRDHPLAVVGSFVVFLVYYYLLLYHLQYFSFIIRLILNRQP
jgi:hypothetical protein